MTIRTTYNNRILPIYSPPTPVFVRGRGSRVWDDNGREYIDFGGGIAVLSLGHCFPALTEIIREQSSELMHLSNLHVNEPAVRLAELLCATTFAKRVYLCNSGGEANEAAIKIARHRGVLKQANKFHVFSFNNSFHGRIGFAMSASAQKKVHMGFGPLSEGFSYFPFNDLSVISSEMNESVCAIIIEPVQGDGGINIATSDFLKGLRALADQYDALLIFDEIQSGVGRTGVLYEYMRSEVIPDILTSAKGLGSGFPVAATLVGKRGEHVLGVGSHGTTYGGNALAAAVANTVLEIILREGFLDNVYYLGNIFAAKLEEINRHYHCFKAIRQRGLLIGCDMADGLLAGDVANGLLTEGLIVITAGEKTLRLAPALNIAIDDVEEGLNRLDRGLKSIMQT